MQFACSAIHALTLPTQHSAVRPLKCMSIRIHPAKRRGSLTVGHTSSAHVQAEKKYV